MHWILAISLLILFEIFADIFAKEYSLKQTALFWVLALGSYMVANAFWLVAIKNGSQLARGAVIFSVGSAIAVTIIGLVMYGEEVNKIEIIGMVIGIIAIGLISWGSEM
ncbi:hypothetical protein EPO17_03350 [Patescibacteria group bacterium]|nr:MAG: hypothetical protein EPO17_03350 [Patescibacteria group bacterium]